MHWFVLSADKQEGFLQNYSCVCMHGAQFIPIPPNYQGIAFIQRFDELVPMSTSFGCRYYCDDE